LEGEFDNIYLDFLSSASTFYAQTGLSAQAKNTGKKGLDYVIQNQGRNSLLAFNQMLNLADIHFILKEYQESQGLSEQALRIMDGRYNSEMTWLDSLNTEVNKPRAMLIHAKSSFELQPIKDEVFLFAIKDRIDEAILILEKRKIALTSDEDLNILLSNNRELFDFSKKIDLDLHNLTGDEKYLNDFLSRHESSIYNKVRARLQKVDNVKFADLPRSVQDKEATIKANLIQSLNKESSDIQSFLIASQEWQSFLDYLKTDFPAYFQFRYANISSSLDNIQKNIPENTSVVRYIFVGQNLSAIVIDKQKKSIDPS
jgi:hypothetical protein